MTTHDTVVSVAGVTKRYAGHTAVHDLSLEIPKGVIYGLLGPNGAGKTTTIRMIMNIIVPDEGRVELFGGNATGRAMAHRIGYLPEERGLYRKMRVSDLLVFLAEIKGTRRSVAKSEAERWLERLGLGDWREKKIDDLSKGMQQKVQFIATVLHQPDLLILDEPFSGFDPVNTALMKDIIVELARAGTTVLFSTHIMEQAEKLCRAVCIIARGTKVVDGPVTAVKQQHGGRHVMVSVDGGLQGTERIFADRTLVGNVDDYGQYAEVEMADGATSQALLGALVQAGLNVTQFQVAEPTLNKIFIDLVGPEATQPRAEEVVDA
jgi:ABC-2 type transport system ATP-binding protein